ncbi:hypothetical protein BCR42DRAFT_425601 [Absidia repens]|uniref:Uncharacterized protein n=1 Tax=Absidia repens TaxID=90262 RepID=A0A1X2I2C8_9FUNG|nr:hypothetical protein BCR42DRAFT_425601 [Absidia repens]
MDNEMIIIITKKIILNDVIRITTHRLNLITIAAAAPFSSSCWSFGSIFFFFASPLSTSNTK